MTHLAPLPVVATWLDWPEQTLRNWASGGKIRHAKVNGRLEVSPADCLRLATAAELAPDGWRGSTRTHLTEAVTQSESCAARSVMPESGPRR